MSREGEPRHHTGPGEDPSKTGLLSTSTPSLHVCMASSGRDRSRSMSGAPASLPSQNLLSLWDSPVFSPTRSSFASSSVTSRLVVVSNRLPINITPNGSSDVSTWDFRLSSGGLVAALSGVQHEMDFLWVGWVGSFLSLFLFFSS